MKARRIVGWNLRRLRVSKLLTIEDLADAADSHPVYLARLERGEVNVSVDRLERLSKALGIRLADLVVEPAPGEKPPRPLPAGRRPSKIRSKKKPAAR
ncbi:helix-turn-helix domain-containing protein [Reyranella massiliensis]|uniref:helix-turn-helix domain-containing protein n=1 Tax=Reyranella massiliensis TaxID=445220 RepID=UPI000A04D977